MCVAYSPVAVAIQGRLHAHRSFLMQPVGGKTSAGISRYPEGRMPAEGVETYTGIFGNGRNGRNGRTDEPDETDVGEQVEVLLVGLSIP
jgi:hypothetical protein